MARKAFDENEILGIMKASPYNRMGPLFDHVFAAVDLRRLAATLPQIPKAGAGEILLDIGCYGPMISLYRELLGYRHVVAVGNYDWNALSREFSSPAGQEGDSLRVLKLDAEREPLPLADGSVSTVLLLEVLEHFSIDPFFAIAEISRVLAPGGRLVLSTPNALGSHLLYKSLTANNPFEEVYNGVDSNRHNRIYTPHEIVRLADDCGFAVETITTLRLLRPLRYRLAHGLLSLSDLMLRLYKPTIRRGRGELILARMCKTGPVVRRYPEWLYLSRETWRDWYGRMEGGADHP